MKKWLRGAIYTGCAFFITENHLMATQAYCPMPKSAHAVNTTIDVKDFALKNGQTIWYTSDHELDIVTVGLCFQYAGKQSDPKDKPGLSQFLIAMIDEGAGSYDSQAFKKKLIEKNVKLSASSTNDSITIILKTTTANVADAFQLLKLALTDPKFPKDAYARTQQQMTAALMQSLHKPEVIAKEKVLAAILGEDHLYAHDTTKQLKALPTITTDDLTAHLKKTITQSNLLIAASGNIDESLLKKHLEDLISALPKGANIKQSSSAKLQNAGKVVHSHMDISQAIIMFAQPGMQRNDPDFYAAHLLIQALGGNTFESRLWKEIREKRGLSYYVSLGLFSQKLHYGLVGATGTKTTSIEEVIKLIRQQWKNVAKNGITQDELTLQKQFINESYPLAFTKTSDIVKALLMYQSDGLSKKYINEREDLFNRVSLDDIKRVAKYLLKPDELTFLIVGKKE